MKNLEKPLFKVLDAYGIEITPKSGFDMYKNGDYLESIRVSLEKHNEIKAIFDQYRREPLADHWLPYNPICEKCGRVNTTEAYDFDGDIIKYRCECGHNLPGELNGQQDGKSSEPLVNHLEKTMRQLVDLTM